MIEGYTQHYAEVPAHFPAGDLENGSLALLTNGRRITVKDAKTVTNAATFPLGDVATINR